MKQNYFFIWFFLITYVGFTQTSHIGRIDSLFVVLNYQKEDTLKANVYHAICEEYKPYDLKKVSFYNNKLLKLSQKLKYQNGIGLYYLIESKVFLFNNEPEKAISSAKSAMAIFLKTKNWDNYFCSCCVLADYLIFNEKSEEAKSILDENLKIALKKKNVENLANFYAQLSHFYSAKSNYKESLIYAKKSIQYNTNTYDKISIYYNISTIYLALRNYELAGFYVDLAYKLADSPLRKHRLLFLKTDILISEEKYQEALLTCLKNEQFFEKTNEKSLIIYNRLNLAKCYYYLKKYDLSLIQLNRFLNKSALKSETKIKIYELTSKIYLATNKNKEAQICINKAIDLLKPTDYFELKLNLYTTKYKVEQALGNDKTALIYYIKQADIKEEENLKINTNKINELQIDFDLTDKNNKIKKLELVQLKKTIENKKQKDWILYFAIAFVVTLSSVVFFVLAYKTIKKKNKIIESEKLLTQKSLLEKEILIKEIHHRVKNNMQLVISLLKIQSLDAKQLSIEDFVNVSEARINAMALIHENLYKSETLDKVCFKEYLDHLTQSIIGSQISVKKIALQTEVSETFFDIQTAIPIGLIINELVNNAYKHAFINKPNGKINIALKENKDKFTLSVSDNGIGFANKQEQQDGLGLELVRLLVSQIKGILQIDNKIGTIFTIQFQNVI